jgi:hypothetical protein
LLRALAFALSAGLPIAAAHAQSPRAVSGAAAAPVRVATQASTAAASTAADRAAKSAEQYYVDFRARYSQTYGHTFVVFGRGTPPVKRIPPNQIAGLTPATDNPIPFYLGHILPVPSETTASEGDDDPQYMSAHYLVRLNKAEYDQVVAYIKNLQATHPVWHAVIYNCNDFVADIARFVGLKVPSTMLFARYFIEGIRDLNAGTRHAAIRPVNSAVH